MVTAGVHHGVRRGMQLPVWPGRLHWPHRLSVWDSGALLSSSHRHTDTEPAWFTDIGRAPQISPNLQER